MHELLASEAPRVKGIEVANNLTQVQLHMANAAAAVARDIGAIHLIAVSKTFTQAYIRQAIEAGCNEFAENRVQEAMDKWPELKQEFAHIKLHLVGHLQTNKAKHAVAVFDAIHSLDNLNLAKELAKQMRKQQRELQLFVQVNLAQEPQKRGVDPDNLKAFMQQITTEYKLRVSGLMCIPPANEQSAPYFTQLARLGLQLRKARLVKDCKLSMGMSDDYQSAILAGADYVRVGSAIFGAREQKIATI